MPNTTNAYEFWLSNVKRMLVHPDALLCTVADEDGALKAFYDAKFTSNKIAKELNKRYQTGYLERKQAMDHHDISEFPLVLAIPVSRIVVLTYHLDKQSANYWRTQYKQATLYINPRFAMLAATPDTDKVACENKREV